MDGSTFYPIGIVLVVAALVISFIGIRGKDKFPPGRGVMLAGLTVFILLIAATATFAVVNGREEQEHHAHEYAEFKAEAEAEEQQGSQEGAAPAAQAEGAPGGEPAEAGPPGGPPGGPGEAETIDVTSPEDGSLVFEPDGLEAAPGPVTISYANPSPIPHNISLEFEGETIAESEDITDGEVELTAELQAGEYVFYCSVPGHRESGMEGDLTVE
jgi:plastocyanin